MSKRDPRRGLSVRLPDELRKRLVQRSPAHLPLSYLARHAFREALETQADWTDPTAPGANRPILVQLAPDERDALEARATARGVSAETALLSLVAQVV